MRLSLQFTTAASADAPVLALEVFGFVACLAMFFCCWQIRRFANQTSPISTGRLILGLVSHGFCAFLAAAYLVATTPTQKGETIATMIINQDPTLPVWEPVIIAIFIVGILGNVTTKTVMNVRALFEGSTGATSGIRPAIELNSWAQLPIIPGLLWDLLVKWTQEKLLVAGFYFVVATTVVLVVATLATVVVSTGIGAGEVVTSTGATIQWAGSHSFEATGIVALLIALLLVAALASKWRLLIARLKLTMQHLQSDFSGMILRLDEFLERRRGEKYRARSQGYAQEASEWQKRGEHSDANLQAIQGRKQEHVAKRILLRAQAKIGNDTGKGAAPAITSGDS